MIQLRKLTYRLILIILAPIFIFSPNLVSAHEPVFSLGPETIYKGGVGVEAGAGFDKGDGKRETEFHYEVLYGLTPNVSLTLEIPHLIGEI